MGFNLIADIEGAEHTFAAWAEKELAALHAEAPSLESTAAATLKYVGPILQMVVTAEAGAPAGALVGKVIADAQAGLTAAAGFIYDYGATPTAGTIIGSVVTNLQPLLSAGKITNAASVANVTTVVTNLNALTEALSPPAAVAAGAPAPSVALTA